MLNSDIKHECSKLLSKILNLENIDANLYRSNYVTEKNRRGIFGGQIIGQSLIAANDTVPENMHVHSMHSYFILPGDPSIPVVYNIEITRNGRSFCTRIVKAIQKGRMIFTAMVSYHILEPTDYCFQTKMPDAPLPEDLPLYQDLLNDNLKSSTLPDKWKEFIRGYLTRDLSFEMKLANTDWITYLFKKYTPNDDPLRLLLWLKLKGHTDVQNSNLHKSIVGYVSDSYLLQSALLAVPHHLYSSVFVVSLDHSLWFHQEFDINDWILFDCENTRYADGRALTKGRFWTREGKLAVSVAQEGLIRLKSKI